MMSDNDGSVTASSTASHAFAGTLYHYTDEAGLLGILRSGRLWATDIRYLNDAEELVYARREVQEQMLLEADRLSPGTGFQCSSSTEMRAATLRSAAEEFARKSGDFGVYVNCLSEERDALGQWRADGSYAIGFIMTKLADARPDWDEHDEDRPRATGPGFQLRRVSYGMDKSARQAIAAAVAELGGPIGGFPGATGSIRLHELVFPVLATIKHPSFADEREWRIVIGENTTYGPEHFRLGKLGVTPYVELVFDQEAVREVVVGPCTHPTVRVSGVRRLLRHYGYESAQVCATDSPFRG